MTGDPLFLAALGAIALAAATVNGAIGYGFSSITVPLALGAPGGYAIPALVALALIALLHRPLVRHPAAAAISGTGGD